MDDTILATIAAAIGFLAKSCWDLFWRRRERSETLTRQKRIDLLERQLSQFYWPLYLHLQKNNAVWEHLVHGKAWDAEVKSQVDLKLFTSFFLPNHEAMLGIIESSAHLSQPEGEFETLLLGFIRHVTIFRTLHEANLPYVPLALGEPWPADFFPVLEKRLRERQSEYDREVGIAA